MTEVEAQELTPLTKLQKKVDALALNTDALMQRSQRMRAEIREIHKRLDVEERQRQGGAA